MDSEKDAHEDIFRRAREKITHITGVLNRIHKGISADKPRSTSVKELSKKDPESKVGDYFKKIIEDTLNTSKYDDLECVAQEYSLNKNQFSDVNKKYTYGWTLIHYACHNGNYPLVKDLIEKGADVNSCTSDGYNCVMAAAFGGYTDILKLLLIKKAKLNQRDTLDLTELFYACVENQYETASILLEYGSDVNTRYFKDVTTLALVVGENHYGFAKLLLDYGAEINLHGSNYPPLITAVKNSNYKMVKLLVERGADVNICNHLTYPVLFYSAIYAEHSSIDFEIFQFLLKNKADPNQKNKQEITPLCISCMIGKPGHYDILIKYGGDINLCNSSGRNAFIYAVASEQLNIINKMIDNVKDYGLIDIYKANVIMYAAITGNINLFNLLISYIQKKCGIDSVKKMVNQIDHKGYNCMMYAIIGGNLHIIKKVYQLSSKIDIIANDGVNCTILAATEGYLEILKFLINSGADFKLRNFSGVTALICAQKNGHIEIEKYLKSLYEDNKKKRRSIRRSQENTEVKFCPEKNTERRTELRAERVTEKNTEPCANPVTEKNTEPYSEPCANPVTEKNTERVTEPCADPVTEKNTESVTESCAESVTEKNTERVTEPCADPVSEKNTESVTEPYSEPVSEKNTEPYSEPVSEKNTESVTELRADPLTETSIKFISMGGFKIVRQKIRKNKNVKIERRKLTENYIVDQTIVEQIHDPMLDEKIRLIDERYLVDNFNNSIEKDETEKLFQLIKNGPVWKLAQHFLQIDNFPQFIFDKSGYSLLKASIHTGSLEIIETLLDFGADVNKIDLTGEHILITAIKLFGKNHEITKILVSKGAKLPFI